MSEVTGFVTLEPLALSAAPPTRVLERFVDMHLFAYTALTLGITPLLLARDATTGASAASLGSVTGCVILVLATALRARLSLELRLAILVLLPIGSTISSLARFGPASGAFSLLTMSSVVLTAVVLGRRVAVAHALGLGVLVTLTAWAELSGRIVLDSPAPATMSAWNWAIFALTIVVVPLGTVFGVAQLQDALLRARRAAEDRAIEAEAALHAQRLSEARLRESERQLRNLFDAIPDVILRLGPDDRIRSMRVPDGTSLAPRGASGGTLETIGFPADTTTRIRDAIGSPSATSILVESSMGGRPRWWEVRAFPEGDDVLVILRDVSEAQRVQSRLSQIQKMESLGHLAGGVAHDFGNMLTGILAFAEVLAIRLADKPDLARIAEQITMAARRAAELTRKLRAFSRGGVVETRSLDVNRVVEEAVGLLQRSVPSGITVVVRLAATSPVLGEAGPLVNAVLNLGINARDAMPKGGSITLTTADVTLDAAACAALGGGLGPGAYVSIVVADTGTGIPPEIRGRIFEPFFSTKGASAGTGLGLALVYSTARDHRGAVTVDSTVGQGSRFTVYLPADSEATPLRPAADTLDGRTGRALVVDDEPLARAATRAQLEELGWTVSTAADGEEALRWWRAHRTEMDVMVLDVVMPGRDGREVARIVLEEDPGARIVLLSGYIPEGAVATGVVAVLQKPATRGELSAALALALRRSGG